MIAYTSNNKLFKRALIGAIVLAVVVLCSIIVGVWRGHNPQNKPQLGIITTLPLRWGEGDINTLIDANSQPLPAYVALEADYQINLIDGLDAEALKKTDVLLLAQPRAFAPHEFNALDTWIRAGGRALILADPALAWESAHPIGDKRRPLFTSLMSPLFTHWGIDLVLPMESSGEKIALRRVSGHELQTVTPGAWQPRAGAKSAHCVIENNGLTTQCTLGKGQAVLIADADLLHAEFWQGTGIRYISGADDFGNMMLIKQYLKQLRGYI
jgi:ABC-type uncharacterized transport system